jgi:hypothetical protein
VERPVAAPLTAGPNAGVAVTLVLTLVFCAVAFTALFWALGVLVQSYLYSQPASHLPVRSVIAGVVVALFVTGWTYLNTRASHPDKYGTIFDFKPTTVKDVTEFEAVRQLRIKDAAGQYKEVSVPFKYVPEGKAGKFVETTTGKDFRLNTADYMTVAIDLPEDGKKTRFDAALDSKGTYALDGDHVVFTEKGGSRYLESNQFHRMNVPSTGAFAAAVALNVVVFVVWFVAFWPVMRFNSGHALILALIFGTFSVLILMPLLFEKNVVKPDVPTTAGA